jgi:Helicase HerA, central domain
MPDDVREWLSLDALDERIAIVGTSGSGKTYAAKGFVERLLDHGTRMAIVDPLGVWWGLRASADAAAAGYPVVVFGGRHADVPIDEGMGAALGRLIAREPLACVVDVSELGSAAARRRFMTAFAEAVYEGNREPLHLVFDEADLWAPQRPTPEGTALLGRIEEIVRRGRVRGFIPWLITQRPAVLHKDVLSQADTLIAMKLTSSQDRAAVGAWIEGQAEEQRASDINAAIPNQGMPAPVAAIDVPSRWQDRKSSHREPKVVAGSGGKGAELRILRVLAQQHPARLAESQWAILSRMKRTGGTWQTYKSRLRSRGLIAQDGREWSVTPEGLAIAGVVPHQPQTPAELRSMWKEALGSAGRLLDVLLDAGGQLPRNELAARAGLTSNAGTFGTYLSRLRSNDLVLVAGSVVRIADALCG